MSAPAGYKVKQIQNYTPEQMQLHKDQFQHLGPDSFLSKLASGDQSFYNEMEAPAMRQFQGLQGDISSRFSGMGMGGRHGSGFQNTMNQATSDFAQDLQSKRMALRNQAIQDLMGMSNTLLGQKPYENYLQKKSDNSGWMGALGAGVGGLGGFMLGGPAGAMTGANLGYGIGSGGSSPIQNMNTYGMSGGSGSGWDPGYAFGNIFDSRI